MRLLISWVRDFVDITASPDAIAERLALRGFEVAAIEPVGDGDAVIDFEVTANRPDCLSVIGFAREIATAYDLPLRLPSERPDAISRLAALPAQASDAIAVQIDAPDLCPRYAAAVATVTAATTPSWMTKRLQAAGVRPISPIVDITNYVLLELGQPMHAFDLATLAGPAIRVRRAAAGEKITTLDDVERALDPEMLVIADAERPQAVAGVMGGAASEVSADTKSIVFESACFTPTSVRRTSKRLSLKTEASSRFERGTDVNGPVVALQRAVALMEQIGAGQLAGGVVDCYPSPRTPRSVPLRRERLARLLGLTVPDRAVVRILTGLELTPSSVSDGWSVDVPTFRVDILREVDLIEEVGRHFGLENLDPTFPPVTSVAPAPDPRVTRDHLLRRLLTGAGLSEAVTFGFIEARRAAAFADEASDLVAVANPLSAKFDTMRPSLLPGLLESVAHNRRHGRRDVALFEIGARFTPGLGETRGLGAAWTGSASDEHWSGQSREVDFFDLKGIVERVAGSAGLVAAFLPIDRPFLVPGRAAAVRVGETTIGLVGQLSPAVAEAGGAPRADAIFVAELNLDQLAAHAVAPGEWVRPLPRHPFVVRDLSIVVADSLQAEIIRGTIHSAAAVADAPLVALAFFDRYQGKGVPAGSISLSVRLTFQAADRTLTDAEVQAAFDKILAALVASHGAVQR